MESQSVSSVRIPNITRANDLISSSSLPLFFLQCVTTWPCRQTDRLEKGKKRQHRKRKGRWREGEEGNLQSRHFGMLNKIRLGSGPGGSGVSNASTEEAKEIPSNFRASSESRFTLSHSLKPSQKIEPVPGVPACAWECDIWEGQG